mmetsp:Transcript_3912/g.7029  ORF Transcript_3912/g.7029 Transcript_3912/m.7029 type:complete len:99 (+) Transcript_3912:227-523(+)
MRHHTACHRRPAPFLTADLTAKYPHVPPRKKTIVVSIAPKVSPQTSNHTAPNNVKKSPKTPSVCAENEESPNSRPHATPARREAGIDQRNSNARTICA